MLIKGKEMREKYLLDFYKYNLESNMDNKRKLQNQVMQKVLKEKQKND